MTKCSNTKYIALVFSLQLLLAQVSPGNAQDRGGYTGSFLRTGLGARALSLGGAYVALANDGYGGYYNPAGVPDLKERDVSLSYRNLSLDRSFTYLGFSAPLPPKAGISLGWAHAGIDNIDGRDFAGNHTGFLSDGQNAFMFAFGLKVHENLNVGIGGTILREDLLDITATGFGINLGAIYKISPNLSVGGAIRDLGAHYTWNTESLFPDNGSTTTDDFPSVFTGGVYYFIPRYSTSILLDIFKNEKSDTGYHLGIENTYIDKVFFRAGLNDGDFAAGFGLAFPVLERSGRLDYSLADKENDPELNHIFSLSILF